MHGKILIIDPIATNRIVLKVKLSAAHYDVAQATTIKQALQSISDDAPDIVLTASHLPDGSAVDLAEQVRRSERVHDIPMLAFQCADHAVDRLHLLASGFDDVMTKPLDDRLLLARVRSLVRVYNSASEWRMRDDTSRALGLAEAPQAFEGAARATLVSNDPSLAKKWSSRLGPLLKVPLKLANPKDDLAPQTSKFETKAPDVFIIDMAQTSASDMMRVLVELRTHAKTRHSGILVVQSTPNPEQAAQALDLGASDLMVQGFDAKEMTLRIKALIRRKHIADQLRATVRTGLEAAVCDPLTGLHNRRYAMPHLTRIAERASRTGKHFAVMLADMDHFKRINDVYGHAAGDAVLIQTAARLRENLRAVDLVARIGGEEFLVVLPGVSLENARLAAMRLCHLISETPFELPNNGMTLTATISIGLAIGDGMSHNRFGAQSVASGLLDEADKALYRAKERGRNQVTLSRPAA